MRLVILMKKRCTLTRILKHDGYLASDISKSVRFGAWGKWLLLRAARFCHIVTCLGAYVSTRGSQVTMNPSNTPDHLVTWHIEIFQLWRHLSAALDLAPFQIATICDDSLIISELYIEMIGLN